MAKATPKPATVISLKWFSQQWKNIPHKFEVNIWNFEVKIGKATKEIFQDSFKMKRFNSKGSSPWENRSSKSHSKHPLMIETGSLRDSIKWKRIKENGGSSGVVVYTDPDGFNDTKKHQGFCYAAVHNGPKSFRTGSVRNMPRRQFMGYSSVVKEKIKELTLSTMLSGLPK